VGEETVGWTGVCRIRFACVVVVNAEVLGQDDGQHQHAKEAFGILEFGGVALEAVQVAFGFRTNAVNHPAECSEKGLRFEVFDAGKSLRAKEVDAGDVGRTQGLGIAGDERR
jgi:hypothetical protein